MIWLIAFIVMLLLDITNLTIEDVINFISKKIEKKPPGGDAPPRRQGSDATTHPHELTKPRKLSARLSHLLQVLPEARDSKPEHATRQLLDDTGRHEATSVL